MSKSQKNMKRIICALLGVVLIQFAALTSVLSLLGGRDGEERTAEQTGVEMSDPAQMQPSSEDEEQPLEAETVKVSEKDAPENALTAPEIMENTHLISHGMGMIDGVTTLNCLESFRLQYEAGIRVFEVDLRMTRDMEVVLRHDWRAGWQSDVSETYIPTLDEFRAKPLLGKYTPLTFRDLLLLMEEYPDICVITDSKFTDAEMVTVQFEAMLEDARELGLSYLFDRMVIQVYSRLMFKVVDSIGDFPYYVYTLYTEGFGRTEEAFAEIAAFCRESSIMGVTMWDYWWSAEYAPIAREYDITAYVHTVNDAQWACSLLQSGVDGVYTDSITPAEMGACVPEATAPNGDHLLAE